MYLYKMGDFGLGFYFGFSSSAAGTQCIHCNPPAVTSINHSTSTYYEITIIFLSSHFTWNDIYTLTDLQNDEWLTIWLWGITLLPQGGTVECLSFWPCGKIGIITEEDWWAKGLTEVTASLLFSSWNFCVVIRYNCTNICSRKSGIGYPCKGKAH